MEYHSIYVFDIKDKNTYDNNRRWIGMSEMKNKVNLSAYKKEMKDVLERLGDETGVHTLREWEKEM